VSRAVATAPVALITLLGACAPKAPPLAGAVVPAAIPATALPPMHRRIVFQWSFTDDNVRVRGDGAARVAPPDSVRLDFFVANGMGSGYALLVGDSVRTPAGDAVRRYLPPVPLLWAALGRLAVPSAPDTAARVDGDTLRVELDTIPVGARRSCTGSSGGSNSSRADAFRSGWIGQPPGPCAMSIPARAARCN